MGRESMHLFNYLSDESKLHIHEQAFIDITNVFMTLKDIYHKRANIDKDIPLIKWVCNAAMGHGKTQVLKAFLKYVVKEDQIPILVAVREKVLGREIVKELNDFKDDCIIMVDAENKQKLQSVISKYPIVVITHNRLQNLALKFGSIDKFFHYTLENGEFKKEF